MVEWEAGDDKWTGQSFIDRPIKRRFKQGKKEGEWEPHIYTLPERVCGGFINHIQRNINGRI